MRQKYVIYGVVLFGLVIALSNIKVVGPVPPPSPDIIYVPDDYPTIQQAIDNSSNGDIIKVNDTGTPYRENVVINKEISLVGDPVIDAMGGIGIKIEANNTLVENFTIYNGSTGIYVHNASFTIINVTINNCTIYECWADTGIYFNRVSNSWINNTQINDTDVGIYLYYSSNNNIRNCNVYETSSYGIWLWFSSNNNITNCDVYDNYWDGIYMYSSSNNNISNCNVYDNSYDGIYLYYSSTNNVNNNTIDENYHGVYLDEGANNNIIEHNNLTANGYGFYIWYANNNKIGYNFINQTLYSNGGSCPFLYTWDGSKYNFVADLNGQGILAIPTNSGYRKPQPEDFTIINGDKLMESNGNYFIQITQEYDEISYLDLIELKAIEHSTDVEVYTGLLASEIGKIYTVGKNHIKPVYAKENGNDCLSNILYEDGIYTEANSDINVVEIGFDDLSHAEEIKLILNGYTDWTPGVSGRVQKYWIRFIQVKDENNEWVNVFSGNELINPAAMPRKYVIDLTGKFITNDYSIRIGNGATVRWDYIAIDTTPSQDVEVKDIDMISADLHFRGYSEFDGMFPDYYKVKTRAPATFSSPSGYFTKFGNVKELLATIDDKFVIMHHGDEISIVFSATNMQEGKKRTYLMHSWDYYKNKYYETGSTVEPLPFRSMSTYPYPESEHYPSNEEYLNYLANWNTRYYEGEKKAGISLPYSNNIQIYNNTIIGGSNCYAIQLIGETNATITNNTILDAYCGIYLWDYCEYIDIIGNKIQNCSSCGIDIENSEYITISKNNISNNGWEEWGGGIYFQNTNYSTISENYFTNDIGGAITLSNSHYNNVINNEIIENCGNLYGMALIYISSYNIVELNDIIDNTGPGIYIDHAAPYNEIIKNYIANNEGYGIYIGNGNHTRIIGNTICEHEWGIWVYGGYEGGYYNTDTEIHWNKIYNNTYGLVYWIGTPGTPYINATYNWWGNGNGPSGNMIDPVTYGESNGDGDEIYGGEANDDIHFDPWIGKMILYKGWNMITLPVWNEEVSTAEELGNYINDIAGYNICTVITKWDASLQKYISYVVGFTGNFELHPGEGYFIFMKDDFNFSIEGVEIEPEVNITLRAGYNLIGDTKVLPTTALDIGKNISNCSKVGRWNALVQQWEPECIVSEEALNFDVYIEDGLFVFRRSGIEQWNG
ncbi:MAG: right-handed parallel beta-helix repeat-containing protein [Candidatus Thermoplasmatota archaeon]